MTRIIVENYELDLTADFSHQITYAVDDLINLDSKATTFTKTLVVPGTANNNKLFGNIFHQNNSNFTSDASPNILYNFNASKSARVIMYVGGLQVMKGILRLLQITNDRDTIEYEISLFGELGGFVSAMGNKRIEDLDFTTYNRAWNSTNIKNSWATAGAGSGIIFPAINYGNVTYNIPSTGTPTQFQNKDYQYLAFRPALYVREYIDKIITGAGYTWESSFMNTAFFKRLIIPNNDKALYRRNATTLLENTQATQITATANSLAAPNVIVAQAFGPTGLTLNSMSYSNTTGTNPLATYTGSSPIQVKISYNLYYSSYGDSSIGRYFEVLKNGLSIQTVSGVSTLSPIVFVNMIGSVVVSLNTGDTIQFRARASSLQPPVQGQARIGQMIIDNRSKFLIQPEPSTFIPYGYGDVFNANYSVPKNIFQKDFFTSILKLFNLMVFEDPLVEKKLMIEPNVAFYNTTPSTYLDWSSKVNRDKPLIMKPMSEVNARYYTFKFKEDNDYYLEQYKKRWNDNYGNRTYDNGLEFAKENKSLEVLFSSSVIVGFPNRDKIMAIICKITNGVEETIDHNIRIMQCANITGMTAWNMLNTNSVTNVTTVLETGLTNYCYAGHFNNPNFPTSDLNFGATKEIKYALAGGSLQNNMFNAYYSAYMADITDKDSRLLTCEMKLTSTDIANLDFRRFVFIDGCLYRLMKVIDWSDGNLCKVNLLRVINTTYY